MPFKQAVFYFGLTVFGAGFYLLGDPNKLILSTSMIAVGGFVAGYSIYAHHHPDKQLPVWVYLLVLTWVAISYDYYDRHYSTPPASRTITSTNLEANVRQWLDEFHFNVKKRDYPQYDIFGFDIVLPNKKGLTLNQPKDRDKFLMIGANISLAPDLMKEYKSLSSTEQEELNHSLNLDLARAKYDFTNHLSQNDIVIIDALPITSDLTEYDVIKGIINVGDGIILAEESISVNLARFPKHSVK